jgi:hypothetical protein
VYVYKKSGTIPEKTTYLIAGLKGQVLMNHRQFLARLFASKPDDCRILIHQLPLLRSKFFKTPHEASVYVASELNGPHNIYTTGGLLRPEIKQGRGTKQDVVGVIGMAADIDLKTEDKPQGVKNLKKAIKLVKGHGIDPSLIVFTGNGIHPWWLFKEPVMFANNKQREEQELLCKRLQETIRQRAKKSGWTIDSTHEVNRVLRIAGTFNLKDPNNPVEVKLIEDTGIAYGDPENDFEDYTRK